MGFFESLNVNVGFLYKKSLMYDIKWISTRMIYIEYVIKYKCTVFGYF